jgi:hypothetical protein
METPYCELCGEVHATLQLAEAAVCDDCFAQECKDALTGTLGYTPCASVSRQACNNELRLCLARAGAEHDHD